MEKYVPFDLVSEKISLASKYADVEGVEICLRHLEAAQFHFLGAKKSGDQFRFNDCIYRSNQVFEGALKEFYAHFDEKKAFEKSPYQIEKFLIDGGYVSERLLPYLTIYRQEWRNPSTHDHRILFGEHEAFLAINTVASFFYVFIDEIVKIFAQKDTESSSVIESKNSFSFDALQGYLDKSVFNIEDIPETELGMINAVVDGYLRSILVNAFNDIGLKFDKRVDVGGGRSVLVDFSIETNDKSYLGEFLVLRGRASMGRVFNAIKRLEAISTYANGRDSLALILGFPQGKEDEKNTIVEYLNIKHSDINFATFSYLMSPNPET